MVCDTDARTVEYIRVEYDIETSAQKIFDADLALNFGKRLFLGGSAPGANPQQQP